MAKILLIIFLVISYFAAVPLSSNIEMNLARTEWLSLWTYIVWFGSLFIWAAIFFAARFVWETVRSK